MIALRPFLLALTFWQVLLLPPAHGQQVVFEGVGQIATALSYLHAAVPLNITGVMKLIDDYEATLGAANVSEKFFVTLTDGDYYDNEFYKRFVGKVIKPALTDFRSVMSELQLRAVHLRQRLTDVIDLMPTVASDTAASISDVDDDSLVRRKRAAPFLVSLLLKGVFGTFQGLYTRRKYNKLREELNTVIQDQRRLVATVRAQEAAVSVLRQESEQVMSFMGNLTVFAPMLVVTKLRNMEMLLEHEIDRIWDAVQTAQHRRLSVRLLTASNIKKLFDKIRTRAQRNGNELLLDRPSDLYQIELSYAYDGDDVTLLLHVPTAPRSTTLRLLKFLPFPFTFSKTHFLMPLPQKRLLAISSDEPRLSMELSEADLEGCHRVNNLFLCERQGTLLNKMDRTCLGSLYGQKYRQALELCEMKALPITEKVLQLSDNWFLVYATQQFTAYISCRNHTSSEAHLNVGLNRISVSPSCSVKLNDHVLHSDTALKDEKDILQFSFSLTDTSFTPTELEDVDLALADLIEDGETDPSLDQLRRYKTFFRRFPRWTWFWTIVGVVAIGLIGFVIYGVLCTHKWMLIRRSLKLIADAVWPSRNPHAIYDVSAPPSRHPDDEDRPMAPQDVAEGEMEMQERRVDIEVRPVPGRAQRGPRMGSNAVEFIRSASRRLRGRGRQQGQPDALPATFRRQRLPLY